MRLLRRMLRSVLCRVEGIVDGVVDGVAVDSMEDVVRVETYYENKII